MSGNTPVVSIAGNTQAMQTGEVIDAKYLPKLVFPNGEFATRISVDACGNDQVLIEHVSPDGQARCVRTVSVHVPVYCNESDAFMLGQIVEHNGKFYVAEGTGQLGDPSIEGNLWSKGHSTYEAAIHTMVGEHTPAVEVADGTVMVANLIAALVADPSTVVVQDAFGVDQFIGLPLPANGGA